MLSPLIIVSFFFALAWIQQQYLNRLMEADIAYLHSVRRQQLANLSSKADSVVLVNASADAVPGGQSAPQNPND
ncbi:MAG: hypothetical protein AAGE59_31670 [Cyanobacteria bacterium P01_F01_bin.86]